ncbi:peptidylprolyl isomerase [Burkholderiaceae bacterium DAT-1]|nr:peptidylprolyl isomerase [Burkholderiaceae bacterium DAT-1]
MIRTLSAVAVALALSTTAHAASKKPAPVKTAPDIIKASLPEEWRPLDPQNTLVMNVNGAQVIMELAARFAPAHAANIRTLAHEGYFDNLAIIRVHDNYVTQWGDPNDEDESKSKSLGSAKPKLPAEFSIASKGLNFTPIPDADGWAPKSGFVDGFPMAADPKQNKAWLTHCYGMIGAARGNETDSSNGSGLYVIIGGPARSLDLNITVVGRVLKGMEALSGLPRGTGNLGFYEKPEQRIAIQSVKLLADLPESDRPVLEVMRTESKSFKDIIEARRHASNAWFVHSPEFTSVCNVNVPIRPIAPKN